LVAVSFLMHVPVVAVNPPIHTYPNRLTAMMAMLCAPAPARLAVAVSGGADSLALALGLREWAELQGCQLTALVVDHGIRRESAGEAAQCMEWLAAHTIDAVLLPLQIGPMTNGVQEAAREARYAAMTQWCHAQGVMHLALGHHQGDQAETVLMRLLRHSGPEGLAAMAMRSEREGITLLRPQLRESKSAMIAYLRGLGQRWIEDPSNQSRQYLRTQLRHLIATHAGAAERLARVADSCGQYRAALEAQLAADIEAYVTLDDAGYARIGTALLKAGDARAAQVMMRVLCCVGNSGEPRLAEVERLIAAMRVELMRPRTLHGCSVQRVVGGMWLVTRELGACAPAVLWHEQPSVMWDRFRLEGVLPKPCRVEALGEAGWLQIRGQVSTTLPRAAILALPALWDLEAVVAVPHIGYAQSAVMAELAASFRHSRAKPLAAPPFWVMNT